MHPAAAIFDLDGTLADTLEDIAAAGNHALAALGLPIRPVPDYRHLAGRGLPHLIRTALGPAHADRFDEAIGLFRAYYRDHQHDHSRPYPGVCELVADLQRQGVRLAVLSNKPDDATARLVTHLFGPGVFQPVRGARPDTPLKPDPAAALRIADALAAAPHRCVYLGDTDVDMQTGRAAGMFTVGVTWGFRDRAELEAHGAHAIIDQPGELQGVLDAAPDAAPAERA